MEQVNDDRPWRNPDWVPRDKQDLVDFFFAVQTGHASCRYAAEKIMKFIKV